ncbi:MAG: glycoside hydrolase family 127 protein [Lachnospiraceae bacterium]|nr:glycoside hydrolase family 127 protein [Lachnospiraceae bacterium]
MELKNSKAFSLRSVQMKDAYLVNAFEKEVMYLTSFDTDKLLAGFRETAGVDMRGATRYEGWESMLIGGHTLGHYMTACVRSCESANCKEEDRQELLGILKRLVDGLAECQEAGKTGFLFGAIIQDKSNVELQFDYVEENKTNIITQAWVPWYTMHKLFEGLVSTAVMDVEGALAEEIKQTTTEVMSKLADWVYGRTGSWSEETHRTVLGIEYGGMNDCLYDVYAITGKKEHLEAAHAFDQTELFERVLRAGVGDNVLNNHHANTTIPKFLGALNRYMVVGDAKYLEYVTHFWDLVTEHHTYITGGNSEWEHFGEDRILDKERTNCNCETCNVYNMQKMTRKLFMITGDVKYADWFENTYINSILSSQNPETGMTTYFQPMASGFYKVYGERFNKFWCCTGTGMENFAKLQEGFYFAKEKALIVNQYVASSVEFEGVTVTQEADIPRSEQVVFRLDKAFDGKLLFRLPYWLAGKATITVNDSGCDYSVVNGSTGAATDSQGIKGNVGEGYAVVEGPFEANTRITLTLPMKVTAYNLPDGANTYGFKYGPVVLSALLGTRDMVDTTTGVNVTIPRERIIETRYIPSGSEKIRVTDGSVDEYMNRIEEHLVRQGDALSFTLTGTDATLTFVPHFSQHKERYGIYFKFGEKNASGEDGFDKSAERIDTVQPGYGQYENDPLHNMTEQGAGSVGTTAGGTSRYAKAGGSFSYTMEVNREGTALLAMFKNADAGKGIHIAVGNVVIYETVLEKQSEEEYFEVLIPISKEAMNLAEKRFYNCRERAVLTFTVSGIGGEESAALCQFLYTVETA